MADEPVLIGEFSHETNTFAPGKTDRGDFYGRREYFGGEIADELRGTNSTVGGFVDVVDDEGLEPVYTVAAAAQPGGVVTGEAYDFYAGHFLDAIAKHGDDLAGVALSLHGAMVPGEMDDGEGPILSVVREAVGPGVPVVATLDLHANVTDQMVEAADALVAYETYPHVDTAETGRRAMRFLLRTIRGEIDPQMAIERPPVLPYGPRQNTRDGPMADVMDRARRIEDRDGVWKVNVVPGFHAADVPSMGFSVSAVAEREDAAREAAREVSETVWERRESFVGDYPGPDEAVERARDLIARGESEEGPVVLADVGDNPGGGGAADGTAVLRALLDGDVEDAGFAIVRDPEVVEAGIEAGVGERVTVTLGGKTDDRHGDSIEDLDGYVKAITDGRFENTGPMETGTPTGLGRTLRFQCGPDDGVDVIVTENRVQPLDAEIWRHVGVQPERLDAIVVKSTNHYRADYEPMASEVVTVNSPGLAAMDPTRFEYERAPRPVFPLDEMDDDAYPDWDHP